MKVAVIGSRSLKINNLDAYLPIDTNEIVSGGANGIDSCAKNFAIENNRLITEFLPEYAKYGKVAPLKRNLQIIDYADMVIAFWDGKSRGTKYLIDQCQKLNKPIKIFLTKSGTPQTRDAPQ